MSQETRHEHTPVVRGLRFEIVAQRSVSGVRADTRALEVSGPKSV